MVSITKKKSPPTLSREAKENEMISLAEDLAEQQLRDGTASAQVITHFLKLGTTKALLEKEKLEKEIEMTRAKTESLESTKHIEELYENAINAMKAYGGHSNDEN